MATLPALPPGFELDDEAPPLPAGFVLEDASPQGQEYDPREFAFDPERDMSGLERFGAGFGRSFVTGWQGLKQAGTSALENLTSDSTGLTGTSQMESLVSGNPVGSNPLSRWFSRSLAEQQGEIDRERALSGPLMDTGAGASGNFIGHLTQLLGPGLAAKAGSVTRAALLPSTIRGGILQGGALGTLQPTATGESRAANTALGAGLGGAIPGGLRVAGATARLFPGVRQAAIEQQAANVLDEFASDPAAVRAALRNNAQLVPDSLPTTAEATGDIGLANLQRTLYDPNIGGFNTALTSRQTANNAARVNAIRNNFGGADDVAATRLTDARDLTAAQALRPIGGISFTGSGHLGTALDRLIQKNQAAPLVRDTLETLKTELPNVKTVRDAHLFRQYMNQLSNGLVDGKASAKLAGKEVSAFRDILDRQMRKDFPEWGQFLKDYSSTSKEIGQVRFGEELLRKSNSAQAAGDPVLNATFLRSAGNLDTVAKKANQGFKRAAADNMLTRPQKDVVEAVRRDLERQMNTMTRGKAVGSNSLQNFTNQAKVQQSAGPLMQLGVTALDPTSGIALAAINQLRQKGGERVAMLVSEAMMDPQRAAEILARVPSKYRQEAIKVAADLLGSGSGSGRRTYQNQRPLEIEIIGGRRVPLSEFERTLLQ
jgi:hypothetical protein